MIKLNDYLVYFHVPDRVTTNKISCEEFVGVLKAGTPYQWKLEFKKEGFALSLASLKDFLDVCVCLEEAELQKLLGKKIACAKKSMMMMEKKNAKTSQNCVMRDVMVWENVMPES
eukprot:3651701-Ditylum_brightwellii.AAC.1